MRALFRSPLILSYVAANIVLASSHLVPPSAGSFRLSRVVLALARSFQGLPEFLSFSVLTTVGLPNPLAMFLSVTILAGLLAVVARALSRAGDELKEVLPALLLISLGFGLLATHAGDLLVSRPVSCTIEASPLISQKVITYYERGWEPGAYYFLLVPRPPTGTWAQVRSTRLDQPITNPCDVLLEVFPPDM